MDKDVLIQIIISASALLNITITGVLIDVRSKTSRIRKQVENDHPSNLREESDERWTKQFDHNQQMLNAISGLTKRLNKNTARTNQLWSRYVNGNRHQN